MVEPLPGIGPHRERAFAPVPKLGARAHAGIRVAEQRQGNGSSQCGEVERRGRHDASPAITRRSDCISASGAHHGQSAVHEHGHHRRVVSSRRRRARDSSAYHRTRRDVTSESTDHPGMPVATDGAGRTANRGTENRVTIRSVARSCDSLSARPRGRARGGFSLVAIASCRVGRHPRIQPPLHVIRTPADRALPIPHLTRESSILDPLIECRAIDFQPIADILRSKYFSHRR